MHGLQKYDFFCLVRIYIYLWTVLNFDVHDMTPTAKPKVVEVRVMVYTRQLICLRNHEHNIHKSVKNVQIKKRHLV